MKKIFVLQLFFALFSVIDNYAQCSGLNTRNRQPVSIGIVISTNDAETIWNALRLANYSRNQGDTVCVFLLGKGVEVDKLVNENKDIKEQAEQLLDGGGKIFGCGTCLQSRNNNEPKICKFSSMKDLYELVINSKKVLTF